MTERGAAHVSLERELALEEAAQAAERAMRKAVTAGDIPGQWAAWGIALDIRALKQERGEGRKS